MDILHIVGGPAVGALIGYCTNYIAVKMLFRPLKPVKIGSWTLPFTPGIMPKRKPALAKALGHAVGDTLLTAQDLKEVLLSSKVKDSVVSMIMTQIDTMEQSEKTIKQLSLTVIEEERYEQLKEQLSQKMTDKVMEHLEEVGIGMIVVTEAKKAVAEKLANSFIGKFINEDLMDTLAQPIGDYVEDYIRKEGRVYIEPILCKEVNQMEEIKLGEIVQAIQMDKERLGQKIEELYTKAIETEADAVIQYFNIPSIVEEKVNAMPVKELENLVLSVMKHELQMVVNLGALIGLVLGILNLAF